MMTSKEIAEMIQRAKEAEDAFYADIENEPLTERVFAQVCLALDELIEFAEMPIYAQDKADDITDGYCWLVDPAGERMVIRVACKYTVGDAHDEHVNDLAAAGFTFYRIPELPDLEVAE